MKKAVASLLAALSISAFAAWDRVGSLQVADVAAQGEAAAKVGQMIGNEAIPNDPVESITHIRFQDQIRCIQKIGGKFLSGGRQL